MEKKSKLKLYRVIKTNLVREKYLDYECPRYSRILVTQFRGGNTNLRVEMGRRRNERREDRTCGMCITGKVEDETHVLLECYIYNKEREKLIDDIRHLTTYDLSIMEDNPSWVIEFILGNELVQAKDRPIVFRSLGMFLTRMMSLRKEWLNGL